MAASQQLSVNWSDSEGNIGSLISSSDSDKYFSLPISTINSTIIGNVDLSKYKVTGVVLCATAAIECTYKGSFKLDIGYGGDGSISSYCTVNGGSSSAKGLSITSSGKDNSNSFEVNLADTLSGNTLSTSKGSYVTFRIYSDAVGRKTYWVKNVYLKIDLEDVTYTATFKNYDGTVLQTVTVNSGSTPTYTGTTPTRASTAEYEYTFSGWSPSLGAITADAVYTAQYTATKRKYNVFAICASGNGGIGSGGGTLEYGTSVTLKAIPSTGYKFVKWSDGVTTIERTVTVTGDARYLCEFVPICVTYDNIFNFYRWKEKGVTSGRGTVLNVSDYMFDFTASMDDAYTDYSYMFKVESGKKYTFRYAVGGTGTSQESFVFFHNAEGDYSWTKLASSTESEWNFTVPDGYSWASIRFDVNTKGETITYANIRIYPADCGYMGNTVPMSDGLDKAGWSMPTPTRSCYKFKGWNTKADGSGKFYTASDAYPADDLVLYSIWEADPPKISDVQVIYGGKIVSSTNKVPAGQSYIVKCKLE